MSGEKALAEAIVARIKVTLPVVAAVIRSAIAASRLRKAYHDKTVLDGIDLDTAGRSGSEETVEMRGGTSHGDITIRRS